MEIAMSSLAVLTRRSFVAASCLLPLSARRVAAQATEPSTPRPSAWAQPIALDGAPNLHRVDNNFFRSAQPDAAGFKGLAAQYGVLTVISLRAFNADEPFARGLDLRLVRYPIHTWNIDSQCVVSALRTLRKARIDAPVLLHCQHGADRTGLVTALYRILYQGWDKDAALDEMQNGNFGYHAVWGNIPRFIRRVNAEQLKLDVGVFGPA
jgi:protein tyrosine/serine phosphatase